MKWLLGHRHYRWEFDRHTVAMYQKKRFKPRQIPKTIQAATAIQGTCPKCFRAWEFSSLDRGIATDCPSSTAQFDVPDKASLDIALESCTVA